MAHPLTGTGHCRHCRREVALQGRGLNHPVHLLIGTVFWPWLLAWGALALISQPRWVCSRCGEPCDGPPASSGRALGFVGLTLFLLVVGGFTSGYLLGRPGTREPEEHDPLLAGPPDTLPTSPVVGGSDPSPEPGPPPAVTPAVPEPPRPNPWLRSDPPPVSEPLPQSAPIEGGETRSAPDLFAVDVGIRKMGEDLFGPESKPTLEPPPPPPVVAVETPVTPVKPVKLGPAIVPPNTAGVPMALKQADLQAYLDAHARGRKAVMERLIKDGVVVLVKSPLPVKYEYSSGGVAFVRPFEGLFQGELVAVEERHFKKD